MADEGPPEAPITVFFSYARADQKAARPIIEALQAAGFSVWWDGLLGGGERFAHTTAAALESAQAVVVLWSRTAIDSHWVHDEATHGRDRRRLVPLSLDGSEAPLGFRQFQVLDVSRARRPGSPQMQRVIEAVAALHQSPPAPRAPRQAAGPRVSRRALAIGGGATVAVGGGGAAVWWRGGFGGPRAQDNTVAVLPFANMSGDPGQNYFADGLSAEVRAALARNAVLKVVGQTSSNVFRAHTEDAKTIAGKLGVAYLLDGNVRRAGDRVRIAAELIDGRSGFSRWSQSFDRALDDIFAVQTEIAGAVTAALTREVAKAGDPAEAGGTADVAAYDAYLRGRAAFALAESAETDRAALRRFDEAIAADPTFAAAHAARSRTLAAIANQHATGAARRALYDDAVAAAQRAVALAPKLADAQSALAFILVSGRLDIRGARAPYERSFTLGAGDPDVLGRYALYRAHTGRFAAAEAAITLATELDPLNPRTFWNTGAVRFAARRFAEAIPPMQRALELNPRMGNVHGYIAYCLLLQGKAEQARQQILKETSPLTRLPGTAIIEHRLGNAARAREAFAALVAQLGDNGLYQQAEVLAQWGDATAAIEALKRARIAGDSGLFLAGEDPLLDPIRKAPELSRLLRELGFD